LHNSLRRCADPGRNHSRKGSSRPESSLSDLLLFEAEEAPGVPLDDVREVSNYVAAMDHGLARLKGGFPLSLRLLREIHCQTALKRGSDAILVAIELSGYTAPMTRA
jgi:hypothetical protein